MAGKGKGKTKYQARRMKRKRVPATKNRNKAVILVCREKLKEVRISVDEATLTGYITFVTESDKHIKRVLVYTALAHGIWTVKIDANNIRMAEVIKGKQTKVDPEQENKVLKQQKAGAYLWMFRVKGNQDNDAWVDCLLHSVRGKEMKVAVSYYSSFSGDGEAMDIPTKVLSDDNISALKLVAIASQYLILLEHFAGISLNANIVRGGISRREYQQIVKLKSKDPTLTARLIAQVLCQAYQEFLAPLGASRRGQIPPLDGNNLLCMVETILSQRKRLNPLATRNQLEIAQGVKRDEKNTIVEDAGIKRRGNSSLLLYDRYGRALRAYVGYMDTYYRNLDLDKVPLLKVEVGNSGFGQLLRVMEQTFAYPNRELYVFMTSYAQFFDFILAEIVRLYNDEIARKVKAMLPTAIGFFLVYSVLAAMARRGNPYAAVLVVAAKAWGWIMNVDMGLTLSKKLMEAGYHYGQMELIHRRQPKEKGKRKLTTLSLYHLELGTHALIDAMSDILAQGVFIVGGKAGGFAGKKLGRLAKWVKPNRQAAKIEVHLKGGKIEKIRAIDGKPTFEIETANAAGGAGKAAGKPLKVVPGSGNKVVVPEMTGSTKGPQASGKGSSSTGSGGAKGGGEGGGGKSGGGGESGGGGGKKGGEVIPITRAKGWKGTPTQRRAIERSAKAGQQKSGRPTPGRKPTKPADPSQQAEVIPLRRPHDRYDAPPADRGYHHTGRPQSSTRGGRTKSVNPTKYKGGKFLSPRGTATEGVTGMPSKHLGYAIEVAKMMKRIVLLRTTNPRGVQHVLKGHPPKGKDLIALNTSKVTGKVTARNPKEAAIAMKEGYYILHKNGRAYRETRLKSGVIRRQPLRDASGKPIQFDMQQKGAFGERTNQAGQVIEPKTRKAVVGDYDMQDVINPNAPGRNLAAVPGKKGANVTNPEVSRFAREFNAKLRADGDVSRIVHGADAQFMQYKMYGRQDAFKGDVIGIMPDGRVFVLRGPQVAKFYRSIGRSRLEIPSDVQLSPGKGAGSNPSGGK